MIMMIQILLMMMKMVCGGYTNVGKSLVGISSGFLVNMLEMVVWLLRIMTAVATLMMMMT